MPEGARRLSQKKTGSQAPSRPSSISSLSSIFSRMASSAEPSSAGSCSSVNTVCSDSDRAASLSSSASSASLQDSHSSFGSGGSLGGSLPYGSSLSYPPPHRNGSDISLDLTPVCQFDDRGGTELLVTHSHQNLPWVWPSSEAARGKLSRVDRVVLEIVETERAYVRDLKSVVEDYLGCIIDCGDLPLKPDEVSTLFCNIEDIYEFNSELLEDLERCCDVAAIAECFVERSEAFDIYTLYCMNYPNSVAVLRDCMKNESLVGFFRERQTTLSHSLPLETYLLKPVQRILKYHLLLQELAKQFDKSSPGYEIVEEAVISMTAVAWYINDMKRKQEHAIRLQEIESLLLNWPGSDLSGFGELVLEGSFRVQRVRKERAFFLFDKMLLITKKRGDNFIYSTHIFCCNLLLVETLKDPLAFRVSDQTIPKQEHTVQAKNQEEKRLWLHYLKRLIVENQPTSIPHKARQVLGDSCSAYLPSLQFNSETIWKPAPSPRLEDCRSHHRGRRQSEPPEFMYTPEKAKKGFSLLHLDGNIQYRRGRRQSAPAKEIEAAFQHGVKLKHTGSEGELCPSLDPIGSSESASTLASSVIEVESNTGIAGLEEYEEEEMCLSRTSALSITEEILELINQSRVWDCDDNGASWHIGKSKDHQEMHNNDEGATSDNQLALSNKNDDNTVLEEDDKDRFKEPPIETVKTTVSELQTQASESSEEETQMQEELEPSPLHMLEELLQECEESESKEPLDECEERNPIAIKVQDGTGENQEKERCLAENSDLLSVKEELTSVCCHEDSNANDHSRSKESTNQVSSLWPNEETDKPAPKRERTLTKRDRLLIEKIRNYYEMAEVSNSHFQRRDSISFIPAGLVKHSVSRYNCITKQDGSGQTVIRKMDAGEPQASLLISEPLLRSDLGMSNHHDHSEAQVSEKKKKLESDSGSNFTLCSAEKTELVAKSRSCAELLEIWKEKEKPLKGIDGNCACRVNAEVKESPLGESLMTLEDDGQQSSIGEAESIDKEAEVKVAEQLPFMVETERKEQSEAHERTVTTVPTFSAASESRPIPKTDIDSNPKFEAARVDPKTTAFHVPPDVAGISLRESREGSLIENSDKILSRVQMLARMYSAKVSQRKTPLHKKVWESKGVPGRRDLPELWQQCQGVEPINKDIGMPKVPRDPQVYGHVFIREQISLPCVQENECIISAAKGSFSYIEGINKEAEPRAGSEANDTAILPCPEEHLAAPAVSEYVTSPPNDPPSHTDVPRIKEDTQTTSCRPQTPVPEEDASGTTHQEMIPHECHTDAGLLIEETSMNDIHLEEKVDRKPRLTDNYDSDNKHTSNLVVEAEQDESPMPVDGTYNIDNEFTFTDDAEPQQNQSPVQVAAGYGTENKLSFNMKIDVKKDEVPVPEVVSYGTDNEFMSSTKVDTKLDNPLMPELSHYDMNCHISSSGEAEVKQDETPKPVAELMADVDSMDVALPLIDVRISLSSQQKGSANQSSSPLTATELPVTTLTGQEGWQLGHNKAATEENENEGRCMVEKGEEETAEDVPITTLRSKSPELSNAEPQGIDPDLTEPRVQLPKFTSQRPSYLTTTVGRRGLPQCKSMLSDTFSTSSCPKDVQTPLSSGDHPTNQPCALNACEPFSQCELNFSLRRRSPSPMGRYAGSSPSRSFAAACISQSLPKLDTFAPVAPSGKPQVALSLLNTQIGARPRDPSPSFIRPSSDKTNRNGCLAVLSSSAHSQAVSASPSPTSPLDTDGLQHPLSTLAHSRSFCPEIWNSNNNNSNALELQRATPPSKGQAVSSASLQRPLCISGHNRIARPYFSASEPSSRIQSPSPSFARLCSTPTVSPSPCVQAPPENATLKAKPPHHPLKTKGGRSFRPISVAVPDCSGTSSAFSTSPCCSPRIISPTATSVSPLFARSRGNSLPFVNLTERSPSPFSDVKKSWGGHRSLDQDLVLDDSQRSCGKSPARSETHLNLSSPEFNCQDWPDFQEKSSSSENGNCTSKGAGENTSWEEEVRPPSRSCRSTVICAYVASPQAVEPELLKKSSPLPNHGMGGTVHPSANSTKGTGKASYSTTVNLQIGGSGKIASFSNAQVSLTQTLVTVPESQSIRRINVNSCVVESS
ncbi:uncharacterized protein plekhg2 isoform X2 [Polypterus senegalus]|uniref:uncharacterized protein plekhg2 isoform X2 n=1 Tax=Polypterus senegalus TaxID=55291 RepID=UPI00196393C6|nr:uncharacterized protein plekhg2 isoform X2 [Polypterus senegalus]